MNMTIVIFAETLKNLQTSYGAYSRKPMLNISVPNYKAVLNVSQRTYFSPTKMLAYSRNM
jgi:hypothetical protein